MKNELIIARRTNTPRKNPRELADYIGGATLVEADPGIVGHGGRHGIPFLIFHLYDCLPDPAKILILHRPSNGI